MLPRCRVRLSASTLMPSRDDLALRVKRIAFISYACKDVLGWYVVHGLSLRTVWWRHNHVEARTLYRLYHHTRCWARRRYRAGRPRTRRAKINDDLMRMGIQKINVLTVHSFLHTTSRLHVTPHWQIAAERLEFVRENCRLYWREIISFKTIIDSFTILFLTRATFQARRTPHMPSGARNGRILEYSVY